MTERFDNDLQRAVFFAAAAFFLAAVSLSIASVSSRVGRPSPGFAVWSNLVVPALSTGRAAAEQRIPFRSVLTRVDGAPVENATQLREALEREPQGAPHEYTFRRADREHDVTLPASTLAWRDVLPVFVPYLLVGSSFMLMGLIVFYFRPALPAAHAALAAGSALGATLILALDTVSSGWVERPYFIIESLVPGTFLHFALCFPEEKQILKRYPALVWLSYLLFLPLGILENVALRRAPEWHLALNDWVYTAIALTGLVMVGSLLHTFATSPNPLARQRAKVVTAGLAAAALVPAFGVLSLIVFGARLPIDFLSPFFLFFPLSVAYAIARHDLFEVDRYLRTGVVYGALSLLVFVGWAGVVLAAEQVIGADQRLPTGMVPLYLVVVLLIFQPARARIQRLVDRLFSRQGYSYRGTVERTAQALASLLESDRIADALLGTLTEIMAIEWGVLFVFGESTAERRLYAKPDAIAARVNELFPPGSNVLTETAQLRRLITAYEVDGNRNTEHPAGFDFRAARSLGTALILPLRFEEKPVGVLLVGEKRSGAFYSDEDVALLQTLVHQSALALENARAYELLRHTRDELVRAERLAAVGQLSAAVAHGIRNPLAGIRAAAQVAREDLEEADGALVESLDDIVAETDRLEARIRTVLDLSRSFEAKRARGDLNAFLRRLVSDFRARVPANVEVSVALDPALPEATFDTAHLTEALDVLMTNALQAMNGSGHLVLTSRLERDGGQEAVKIEVRDDGPDMSPAQLERVFELFYTTKIGGTGIGLPMAKRFIEAQGGSLALASEPGAGTTATIRLPVA